MEVRELRYFLAVAKEGSVTQAAKSLNITQPGLSKVIMNMENQLGKKLFVRKNRKIILTDDGILLRKKAQEIVDLIEKTESELTNNIEYLHGDIYIGSGETQGMRIIAQTIKRIQEKYSDIHCHLFSGNGDDVIERLDKGLLDFGILIEPVDIKKYDYIRLPCFDTWGILMKRNSPIAHLEYVSPSDIINLPLMCSRRTLIRKELSSWLGTDLEKLNIVSTFNLIFNATILVDEGIGYAITLDNLVNTSNTNLCFKPFKPTLKSNLVVVWKKYQILPKATQKFLDELQREILNKPN